MPLNKRRKKEVKEDPNLVALGSRRKSIPFTSSHFPPQQILFKPFFFQLILRFSFTMVLDRYLQLSFLFLNL
jgi:hypothetical protein